MSFTIHPKSPNPSAIPLVKAALQKHEPKVRQLLPELSADVQLYVYDEDIIPETGTGGYAYSPTILSLAIDNNFQDKKRQQKALIGTIFHESYHLVQGHTGYDAHAAYTSALDCAVYEGCATVFERVYADVQPLWGDYSMHSQQQLQSWRDALSRLSTDDWLKDDGALWQRWSFYDTGDSQRWKTYKVGTWIVDSYLRRTGQDIRDIRTMAASQIAAT